ncbi:MAG: NTP transferase domain-containing protein [Lachnospiraceae bacterium]|nr:NTP transferase domain-containing protein [Lachnospiraceae bacterium]
MFIGTIGLSIVDVMERIDANANGILFLIGEQRELVGCVTDGDIRRWLIHTGDLGADIRNVMKNNPKYIFREEAGMAEEIMEQERITALPVLNEMREVLDVLVRGGGKSKLRREKADLSGVPVVIMAGGKGTRLYPYTKILPKPLIPIGETPIIERIMNRFFEYRIHAFYITVNYKKGMLRAYFSDLMPTYQITYIEEEKPLGTGGGLKLLEGRFHQPLFVTNCDSLVQADYGELYEYHKASGNVITVVSSLKNIIVPYGVLQSKENGELVGMTEKPKHSYFINTGMYVINPDVISLIPCGIMFHMPQLIDHVMKSGGKVGMYPVSEDSFLDMGELGEMKRMEEKLKIVSE